MEAFWSYLFGFISGAFGSMIIALWLENIRKPRLTFRIEEPIHQIEHPKGVAPAVKGRYLRIIVKNEMPRIRVIPRSPAFRCKATISFYHLNGQPVFSTNKMRGRWINTPQPYINQYVDNKLVQIPDPNPFVLSRDIDIPASREEGLDIAAKFDNENDCFGWTQESYVHMWRHPAWKLPQDRYIVKIEVESLGYYHCTVFRLDNSGDINNFRLVNPLKEDRKIVLE